MLLHKDKEALEEAIRATAQHLSLPIEYVEKDYWVTYALRELASSNIGEHIVFKGGTSLSKAYSLISRFSEDIDIAVLTEGLSTNQTKNKVKRASKIVGGIYEEIESPDNSKPVGAVIVTSLIKIEPRRAKVSMLNSYPMTVGRKLISDGEASSQGGNAPLFS